jgi:hypothetical protein
MDRIVDFRDAMMFVRFGDDECSPKIVIFFSQSNEMANDFGLSGAEFY